MSCLRSLSHPRRPRTMREFTDLRELTSHDPAIIGQPWKGRVGSMTFPQIGIHIKPAMIRHRFPGKNLHAMTPIPIATSWMAPAGELYRRVCEDVYPSRVIISEASCKLSLSMFQSIIHSVALGERVERTYSQDRRGRGHQDAKEESCPDVKVDPRLLQLRHREIRLVSTIVLLGQASIGGDALIRSQEPRFLRVGRHQEVEDATQQRGQASDDEEETLPFARTRCSFSPIPYMMILPAIWASALQVIQHLALSVQFVL